MLSSLSRNKSVLFFSICPENPCAFWAMMVTENHRNCYPVVVLKGEEPGLLKVGHIVTSL